MHAPTHIFWANLTPISLKDLMLADRPAAALTPTALRPKPEPEPEPEAGA
jgi:hypothetical protein